MSDAVLRFPEPTPTPTPTPRADVQAMEDRELCSVVRESAGSALGRAAYGELYARYREPALAQALAFTRDRSEAEDLVSETFTRVLRALANGKGPTESVLGYVLIALRSEAIRTNHTDEATVTVAPDVLVELFDDQVEPEVEKLGERDQIGRAYDTLAEDARRVLWLLEVEGVTPAAASEHLGMQSGAIRVIAHRARKKLAAAYLQQYVETSNPTCAEAAGLLGEYVQAELGKRGTAKVEQHLPGCRHCTTQASRLRDLGRQLRAWAGPLIVGGSVAGGAALAGADASAASVASHASLQTPSHIGPTEGAASGGKIAGWVGLAAGVVLIAAGALALLPREAAPPITGPVTGTETTSPLTAEAGASESTPPPGAGSNEPGSEPGPEPGTTAHSGYQEPEASQPLKSEPTVSPDDTTPNWILRD